MALASVLLIGCLGKLWLWLQEWSCDGGLCSSCHYRDQLVSRNTWQREHGLYASVSGCPSQMSQIALPRSLGVKSVHTVTTNALLLCCSWRRMQKPQSIFYLPSRIWWFFFFSFCFCLFPFHLKCSLVGQKDCSKKSHEIQLFLHGSFIYRGQYWRRLPKQEVVNCGQFSVSHLAAYFIYISPGGRLLALLSVGNLPWLPAACCTTRLLFLWSRPISVLKYTPFWRSDGIFMKLFIVCEDFACI